MVAGKGHGAQALKVAALLGALYVLGLAACIVCYPSRLDAAVQRDAAIVLGAAISGSAPSSVFASRLDYAFDLLQTARVRRVILTGGVGAGKQLSEAAVGERYLIQRGASPASLLAEHSSKTTLGNLCNAQALARSAGLQSFVIISDPLHLRRALGMAEDIGLPALPAATPHTRYHAGPSAWEFLARELHFSLGRQVLGPRSCAAL